MATALRVRMGPRPGGAQSANAERAAATGAGLSAAGGVSPRPAVAAVTGAAYIGSVTVREGYPAIRTAPRYVAPPASPSAPALNTPFADGAFPTQRIIRITDTPAKPRNVGSPVFTADDAYIMLINGVILLDNPTGPPYSTVTYPWNAYGYFPGMTLANADKMWMAWSGGVTLYHRSVSTGSLATAHGFGPDGYSEILLDTHGTQSWDDKYLPISAKKVSDGLWYCLVYDLALDSIVRTVGPVSTKNGSPSRIGMSASGTYFTVTDINTQVMTIYNRATGATVGTVNQTVGSFPHHDKSIDTAGDDVIVAVDGASFGAGGHTVVPTIYRMSDGRRTKMYSGDGRAFSHTGHVSAKCINMGGTGQGGWAFFSEGSSQNAAYNPPGYGQIIAMKLTTGGSDGAVVEQDTREYAYHYPYGGTDGDAFPGSPKAVPNASGTKVVFWSNMGLGGTGHLYLAELAP